MAGRMCALVMWLLTLLLLTACMPARFTLGKRPPQAMAGGYRITPMIHSPVLASRIAVTLPIPAWGPLPVAGSRPPEGATTTPS